MLAYKHLLFMRTFTNRAEKLNVCDVHLHKVRLDGTRIDQLYLMEG